MHLVVECYIDRLFDALRYTVARVERTCIFYFILKMSYLINTNIVSGVYAVYIAYNILYYI